MTMYGWGSDGTGAVGWIAMAVVMVLFWGGVVTVVVVLLRRSHSDHGLPGLRPPHHEAERILHERFARGEIDETEYLARRAALRRPE
jgi:putative membrane protein